jgi:hypothetical protein
MKRGDELPLRDSLPVGTNAAGLPEPQAVVSAPLPLASATAAPMPDEEPLVSVIVPVYNVENYLSACLDALLAQRDVRLQIIAVDDGSSDGSGHILDAYAACHPTLEVVHTKNQGLGQARVEGLAPARGSYIGFCDSDDVPDVDMYATLLARARASAADVVVCGFKRVDAESGRLIATEVFGDEREVLNVAGDPGLFLAINTAVWNKLYRAELIDEEIRSFLFPRVVEDLIFELLVYRRVKRIAFVEQAPYRYAVRTGSLMSGMTTEELKCLTASLLEVRERIASTTEGFAFLELCDLAAFTHLGLSFPLHLADRESRSLPKVLRQVRAVLDKEFPLYAKSRLCSLAFVLTHRGKNAKLFAARVCHRLHLSVPLIRFLRFCARRQWRLRYW